MTNNLKERVINNINLVMAAKNINPKALASDMRYTTPTPIYRMLSGKTEITFSKLSEIAVILRVDVEALLK